jgi:beta-glucosidase
MMGRKIGARLTKEPFEQIETPSMTRESEFLSHRPARIQLLGFGCLALPWEAEHLPAILQVWYPGEEGGRAVGEILFGDVNPSGHLPLTFYRATADLPSFTEYSMSNRTYRYYNGTPLYAFGHGLSYTKFDFKSGKLGSKEISADGLVKVIFTVKNSGSRDGDEVAQVYYRHVNSTVPQPKLALWCLCRARHKHHHAGSRIMPS